MRRFTQIAAAAVMVVAGVGAAAPAARAVATNLYVDRSNGTCSDAGSGTQSQPYCTIGAAAADAVAGQTVNVAAGTYNENVTPATSGTSSAAVTYAAAPPGAVTVGGGKPHGFSITNKSYVTVRGFVVSGTTSDGISVSGGSHVTISGNRVTNAGLPENGKIAKGIWLGGVTDSTVSANTADHNTDAGIFLTTGATRVVLTANTVYSNARQFTRATPGIDVRSNGNTISGNISHDNEDSGIQFSLGATGNKAVNNVVYANGDHGIDVLNSPGQTVVGNAVYDNETSGINFEGSSTNSRSANNISVDNAINSTRTKGDIRVESGAISGTVLDYDEVFLHSGTALLVWGSTPYSSVTSFRSATGQEAHGRQADPAWVAPATGDFHLRAGSAAIDHADSGVPGQTAADLQGNRRIDDPSVTNTGAGSRTYDDLGPYEFQPPGVNLVANSGFETDVSGWNPAGSGVTLTRASGGHSGSWSALVSNGGSSSTTCTLNDYPNWIAATIGGTYTAKVWVKAGASGATLRLRLREFNGSVLIASSQALVTLSSSWQQVSLTYAVQHAGSTLDLAAYSSSPPGACFYADDVSITRS